MTAEREMTLHEWVGKLPEIHLARKEFVAMQDRLAALEAAEKHNEILQESNRAAHGHIATLEAAAIVPIVSLQDLGTPGRLIGYRCVFCRHDGTDIPFPHDSGCVMRGGE